MEVYLPMKKIVSLLLSLMLLGLMSTAMAGTVDAGVVEPGTELTIAIELTSVSGKAAQIGIETGGAPVAFVDANVGSANDTVPPNSDVNSGLKGYFMVVNMPNVTLDKYGNPTGTDTTVADLVPGVVGSLTIKVNEDAAPGTYTVSTRDVLGGCTVDGSVTFTVAEKVARVPGDANDDGVVDTADALMILQYISGFEVTPILENADCDGQSGVTTGDALIILQAISGFDVKLQ